MDAPSATGDARRPEAEEARTELALEREKLQIERERLALERDRLQAEREAWRNERAAAQPAGGRVSLATGSFAASLLAALLVGAVIGGFIVSRLHGDLAARRVPAGLFEAIVGATNEAAAAAAQGRLLRALGQPGRGGYLLILD
jgi:hypothetical protein